MEKLHRITTTMRGQLLFHHQKKYLGRKKTGWKLKAGTRDQYIIIRYNILQRLD